MPIQIIWADELYSVLQAQQAQYQTIIDLLTRKQRALVGNHLGDLLELDAQLRTARQTLLQQEIQRLQVLRAAGLPTDLKLGDLIARYQHELNTDQTRRLRQLHTEMAGVLVTFRDVHLACERLTRHALDWVQDTIRLIGQTEDAGADASSYNDHGQSLKGYSTDPRPIATDHRA